MLLAKVEFMYNAGRPLTGINSAARSGYVSVTSPERKLYGLPKHYYEMLDK